MEKFKKLLLSIVSFLWENTKKPIKDLVYSEAFILTSAKLPFLPKWATRAVVKWTLNKTINPLINEVYAEIGYQIDIQQNGIILKRIENAQNINDWSNAIDDLMQSGNHKKSDRGDIR